VGDGGWRKKDKYYKLCRGYLALPFWLASIAALIVAPASLLAYLMNDIKLVKDIEQMEDSSYFWVGLCLPVFTT
jgi:hypothetical protein